MARQRPLIVVGIDSEGRFEQAARLADEVLYGSYFTMRDPAPQLGWVCYAKIPLEDKKKILGRNIQRLLQ